MTLARRETATRLASKLRFGFTTRQVESVVSCGTVATLLAPNNPDRVFLEMILEGANTVHVGRNGEVTTSSGIPLANTGDSIAWTPERDGVGTGYERWGKASVGASNVRVIETIRVVEED